MMKHCSTLCLTATAAVLGVVSIPAQAVTSSFGFTPAGAGVTTFTGSTLDTATSITVPADEKTNGATTGAFTGLPSGTSVILTPTTVQTGPPAVDFTVTFFGDTFTFTGEGPTAVLGPGTTTGISAANSWSELGFLTDSLGHITVPGGALGTLSAAFTQPTFPTLGLVNSTFSFSTDVPFLPPTTTPEPGNVAMLVGLGLSGVSFVVRRRRIK